MRQHTSKVINRGRPVNSGDVRLAGSWIRGFLGRRNGRMQQLMKLVEAADVSEVCQSPMAMGRLQIWKQSAGCRSARNLRQDWLRRPFTWPECAKVLYDDGTTWELSLSDKTCFAQGRTGKLTELPNELLH
jgi:hypothetical protein